MNRHEQFGRKVLAILEDRMDWDKEVVFEIAKLAEIMDLATGAIDGEFEAI